MVGQYITRKYNQVQLAILMKWPVALNGRVFVHVVWKAFTCSVDSIS